MNKAQFVPKEHNIFVSMLNVVEENCIEHAKTATTAKKLVGYMFCRNDCNQVFLS